MQLDKIIDSKSGLYFNLELSEDSSSVEQAALKAVTSECYKYIRERVLREVPTLLTYVNFFGEAEAYIYANGILYTPTTRTLYARALYNDFVASLDQAIQYDFETQEILLSPYVFALEDGDFYRPALAYVSKLIEDWIAEYMSM